MLSFDALCAGCFTGGTGFFFCALRFDFVADTLGFDPAVRKAGSRSLMLLLLELQLLSLALDSLPLFSDAE